MDIVNQRVSRSQGATAFGTDSYQQIYSQYKSSFTFISGTLSYGESITLPVPQAVDSCWTTGNIFRLDNDSGIVKKTSFSNELQNSLELNSPFSLSVIQHSAPMEDPPDRTDECVGCWIVDGTSVINTDSNLNVMFEITNITSPTLICTNHNDNGCYVLDLGVGIYAFSSSGDLVGSSSYTNNSVIGFLSNSIGELFVLTETELLKFVNTNGSIDLSITYDLSPISSTMVVGCFDIDTNTDYLYVAAGNNTNIETVKFNSSGGLIDISSSSGKFPHILKVSQHPSSSAFFVIADDRQIEIVNSSSSSSGGTSSSSSSEDSSSSSSLGYSSSSSSSLGYSSSSSSSLGYSSSSSSSLGYSSSSSSSLGYSSSSS